MTKFYYEVDAPDSELRTITLYNSDLKIIAELEALPNRMSDNEEVQFFIDTEEEYEGIDYQIISLHEERESQWKVQLDLMYDIQKIGVNLVNCGNCGAVLLHRMPQERVKCFSCFYEGDPCDFPDLFN